MDPLRDDGISYENACREHGVDTKVDVYPGVPHCWWEMFPQLEASKKQAVDSVNGFKWLLQA